MIAFGTKKARGDNKNEQCLEQVEKLSVQWLPDVLVLQDVHSSGSRRAVRIKELHSAMQEFAKSAGITVIKFSGRQVREILLDDPKGTKHQLATEIAERFPYELGERLPPKRRAWEPERERMSIFDAAALAVTLITRRSIKSLAQEK